MLRTIYRAPFLQGLVYFLSMGAAFAQTSSHVFQTNYMVGTCLVQGTMATCGNTQIQSTTCAQYGSTQECLGQASSYESYLQNGHEKASADAFCSDALKKYGATYTRTVKCAYSTVQQPTSPMCTSGIKSPGNPNMCQAAAPVVTPPTLPPTTLPTTTTTMRPTTTTTTTTLHRPQATTTTLPKKLPPPVTHPPKDRDHDRHDDDRDHDRKHKRRHHRDEDRGDDHDKKDLDKKGTTPTTTTTTLPKRTSKDNKSGDDNGTGRGKE